MQEWEERTFVRVTRKLPQHNVLMSYWWRRGRHIVERTVRGAKVCKCYPGCFFVFIQTYNYVVDFFLWSHVNDLGYEGKVAMVSWVESAESYIFQTKEILMARHPTFVLRKLTCTKMTICCQGHLSQEKIMKISKKKLPLVWICRPFWCPGPRSQGCKSSSGQLQPYFPSCSQPGKIFNCFWKML